MLIYLTGDIMGENTLACQTVSATIMSIYTILTNLSVDDILTEDTFNSYIDKLKVLVPIECEEYDKLGDDELLEWYEALSDIKEKTPVERRIFTRLSETFAKREGNRIHNGVLLSAAIDAKIAIDIFHNLLKEFSRLFNENIIDIAEYSNLVSTYNSFRYGYFSINSYLELMCINSYFDLSKIKEISFKDLENRYQIHFTDNLQNTFYNFIISAINDLKNLDYRAKYLSSFTALVDMSRVNVALPYLNQESLKRLTEFLESPLFTNEENEAILKIKRLVNKRRSK